MRKYILITAFVASLFVTIFICCPRIYAVTSAGFEAGRIIDDVVMANKSSMNVSQIQAFLNSKVPVCDNWGTNGSTPTSRRDATLNAGYKIPMTCLKDYTEGGKSSAQIIYDAAQEYSINPQVLIVLLQKEQGLITDDWPWESQYRAATGYGCPDGAPCDAEYYGFTNQVRNAAEDYHMALTPGSGYWSQWIVGTANNVPFSPDPSCGVSSISIENRATWALYTYTPYQPNQASLNAGYGTGDYCSSYGNRNFYLYFTDWFGSTHAINGSITLSKELSISKTDIYAGDTVTASYEIANSASYDIQAGGFGICARLDGSWYDFGFIDQNTIAANNNLSISFSKRIDRAGGLNIFICSYNNLLGGWANSLYPYNTNNFQRVISKNVKDNTLITSGVWFSTASPSIGQPVTIAFTITNNSSNPVSIGSPVVAVRDPSGKNVDFSIDSPITIPANSFYEYNKTRIFNSVGNHRFFISNLSTNGTWDLNYPKSTDGSITRSGSFQVK